MLKEKLITAILTACSLISIVNAQVIPNSQTQPNAPVISLKPIPSSYGGNPSTLNYVRVYDAEMPFSIDSFLSSASRTVQQVKQTTKYFDGLGRPIQTVVKAISPNGYDMVTPQLYDSFNREQLKYLPYISPTNDGNFKSASFTEQSNFMTNFYSGEQFFYGQTIFEPSPLNRETNTYAPGNSWAGHAIGQTTQYLTNTINDSVVIWSVGYTSGNTPTTSSPIYYLAGQLLKNVATDEQGHQTIEYLNKEGQLILKKVQSSTSIPVSAYTGWLCTYYIYDNLNNLRFVIQPLGVTALLSRGWAFDGTSWATSALAKGLCFSYEFDALHRMIIKRVPGTGEVWMVYDSRDRLVMKQDSLLRSQGVWLYTNYDSLNRPILTGSWLNSNNQTYHQGLAGNTTNYPSPTSGNTVLNQTWYDNYNSINSNGSGLSAVLITTYISNQSYFYAPSDGAFPYPRTIASSNMTQGMAIGTKVNILGTSNYIYSVNFYDNRARVIQTHSTNYSGGKDTLTMQYGFTGKILRTLVGHGKSGTNILNYSVLTKDIYDAALRLIATTKIAGTSLEDSISVNSYDELSHISLKKLGRSRTSLTNYTYTANPLDTMRYSYNIHGWITGINKDYANSLNSASNWFGMELDYDFGFSQTQLNGNIAGMKWRNGSDGAQRAYGFSYDAANRLVKGDFTQYTSNTWNTNAGIDFSLTSMSYDNNGNILNMTQKGLILNTSQIIDSLLYGYNTNSNQLNYVTDKAPTDTASHLGDFNEINNNTSQDYTYDGNGNLTIDNNKGISSISYNYLNLPQTISITGKGTISYVYDAGGNKLQKITIDNPANKKTVTTYLGGFIYQYTVIPSTGSGVDTLQFIGQEEGRIRPKNVAKSDTMNYDFFEKDHLGNTRVVLTDEPEQDVYPAATLENNTNAFNTESSYYNIKSTDTISVNRIASWPSTSGNNYVNNNGNPPYNNDPYANTTAISNIVYRLNGSTGDKTGLGITLKVMTGDMINIYAKSFWHNGTGSNPVNTYLINAALNSFIGAFAVTPTVAGIHAATATALEGSTATSSGVNSWVSTGVPNPAATVPRAYVNWILFNEQFVPVASNCGYDLISTTADAVKSHNSSVSIGTSGYLYVYCSNESNIDVYFDNLQVIQTRGPLLETSSYYPFGLAMAGINDKALKVNYAQNKFRFNGKEIQNQEFSDGSGLEEYDFGARFEDPQIGAWHNIDPLSDKSRRWSTYTYGLDNPERFIDPDGMSAVGADGMTDEQYMEASKPGANPHQATTFKDENQQEENDKALAASNEESENNNTSSQGRGGNEMVDFVRVLDTKTGEINDVILGNADPGARANYKPLAKIAFWDLSPSSFDFVKTSGNWQEAAVSKLKINVRFIFGERSGESVNVIIQYPLVFGLPILPKDFPLVTPTMAADVSVQAVNQAEHMTDDMIKDYLVVSRYDVESNFIKNMGKVMKLFGGTVDRRGSGSPKIKTKEAKYDFF